MSLLLRLPPLAIALVLLGAGAAVADDAADTASAITRNAKRHHVYLVGSLRVSRPWVDMQDAGSDKPGYLVVDNRGNSPDRLIGASLSGATVMLSAADGTPSPGLTIPAGGQLVLQKDGPHLMARDIASAPDPAAPVDGTLQFARAGTLHLRFSTNRGEADQDDQSGPLPQDAPDKLAQ